MSTYGEILSKIQTVPLMNMQLKILSAQYQPFCFGLNMLNEDTCLCDTCIMLDIMMRVWDADFEGILHACMISAVMEEFELQKFFCLPTSNSLDCTSFLIIKHMADQCFPCIFRWSSASRVIPLSVRPARVPLVRRCHRQRVYLVGRLAKIIS